MRPMNIDLSGKVVLITGAGSGIGKCTARMFAECGASIIVHYRSGKDDVEQFLLELSNYPGDHSAVQAELQHRNEIDTMFIFVKTRYGRLDVLINNAGYAPKALFLEIDNNCLDMAMQVNFMAPFICAREAAKIMVEQSTGGKILFVASVDADRPGHARTHYASAKAAEIQLVKNIALELADRKVLVNAISPGAIETKILDVIHEDPEKETKVLRGIPLKRFGLPEEIGGMLLFLSSDYSGYTTGANITIDGGLSLMRGY